MADEIAVELRVKNAQLANELKKVDAQLRKVQQSMVAVGNTGAKNMAKLEQSANKAAKSVSGMATAFKAVAAISAVQVLGGWAKSLSDFVSNIQAANNQLSSLGGTTEELARIQTATLQIANETGSAYEETAISIARTARALEEFGGTVDQAAIITDSLNKALLLTGTTGSEATSTLVQFTQALQSGTLQGDELRSLRENAPEVIRAIANEMGIATSEIKKAGAEGKITVDIVSKALIKANQDLSERTADLPLTVGRTITAASNSIKDFITNSEGVQRFLEQVSEALNDAAELFLVLAGDVGSTSGEFNEFTQEVLGLENVMDLLVTAVGGVVRAFYTLGKAIKLVLDIAANTFTALGRLIGTFAAAAVENLRALGTVLVGVFTFDSDKIAQGLAAGVNNAYQFANEMTGTIRDAISANKKDIEEFTDGVSRAWSDTAAKVKKVQLSPEGTITSPAATDEKAAKATKENTKATDDYLKALNALRAAQLGYASDLAQIEAAYNKVIDGIEAYRDAAVAAGAEVDAALMQSVANSALDEREKQIKALETAWTDLTVVLDEAGKKQKEQNDLWLQFVESGSKLEMGITDIQHAFDTFLVDTENAEKLAEIKTLVDDIGEAFYSAAESMIFDAESVGDAMKQLAVEVGKLILKFLVLKAIQAATGGLGLGAAVTGGGEVALPGAAAYGSGGATVRIYNNSGGLVTTRKRGNDTDIIIGQMAAAVSRGGNQFDRAMRRAYGLGRTGI